MKQLVVAMMVVAVTATSTHAEMSFREYLTMKDDPDVRYYIQGISTGLGWANAASGRQGGVRLYCEPGDLSMGVDDTTALLEAFMIGAPAEQLDWPVGLAVTLAIQSKFPC